MKTLLIIILVSFTISGFSQKVSPCSTDSIYRQLDFWIGEWEVFGVAGVKAGDSKIERILDSCVILENYSNKNKTYSGKSFNTYNSQSKQWQQTWVDDQGGSTNHLLGKAEPGKMVFMTHPFQFSKDTMAVRKLSFIQLGKNKVRQHAEISTDGQNTWKTEYDLEYRRKL